MLDDHLIVSGSTGTERVDFDAPLSGGSSHPDWFDATARDFFAEVADPAIRGRNLEVAGDCLRVIAAAQASHRAGGTRRLV